MVGMKIGNKVPVAVAPTTLPTGAVIEKRKLRGEPSEGMLCLDQELGLKDEGVSIQYFPDLKPGTPISQALGLDDIVLEFDNKSLTHRPDLWGHYGIAREVAAITESKFKTLEPKVEIPSSGKAPKVEIKDYKLCPRYCGLIIENIKVEDSPDWLKKHLTAVGHGTHNNIVDVTNYVLAELGQPMHAFDENFIKKGITVRRAKAKEKITTLDDKTRQLSKDTLVIADHEKPVAIAGVMGGENSEINEKTTSIILESANFNAGSVRRTSTKLGLRTESVQRFEKSLDPNLAELAIKRAAELILRICPSAKIAGPITDIKDFENKDIVVDLDTNKARSKIGVDISSKDMKKMLEKLNFKTTEQGKILKVTLPSFRATKDIDIEDDLIEEIARMYGYENIPATLPKLPTRLPEENTERFKKHRARELLSYGLGFNEAYNYSFYGQKEIANCLMTEEGHIKLLNYLSEDQTHLRTTLVPNLLKNLAENVKHFSSSKIYEIGRTYKEIGKYMPLEEKRITGAILVKGKTDEPFYEAKGVVDSFLNKFNLPKMKKAKEVDNAPYAHPVKALSYIDQNAQTLAKIFTIHPSVAKNHGLENHSAAFFDLNFTELMKLERQARKYKKIPKFPSIQIDISVIVDQRTEVREIKNAIQKADQNLITDVTLLEIYQGENIAKDKKSTAFKVTLQALDRTLTDEEMLTVQGVIFKNLEKLGGRIRGKKS